METMDHKIYEEAEARVGFRSHLKMFLLVNAGLWLLWYFLRAKDGYYDGFWPIYSTFGWGIGIISHYLGVYNKNSSAVEKEVEKLKRERKL
jgi:hypothetical protein